MTNPPDPFKQLDNERKEFEKISNSNVRKAEKMVKQLDNERKEFDQAIHRIGLLEAKKAERRRRTQDLKFAAEELDEKHASPRSRRLVLTGLNEYYRIVHPHSESKPESKLDQFAPGLLLSEVVEQPIAWLWQNYLPLGSITLLEGEPSSGTSLLALHIAACVTSGCALPGGPSTQGTVILVADQDHPSCTIKPRFLAAGGDPARVLLLTTVEQVDSNKVTIEDRPFSLLKDLYLLEEAVTRTHAALVILDSLDACRPSELRQALPALAQLAQRSGCAILLVCPIAPHPPAAAPKTGSLELLRAVRSGLRIISDPEDKERQRLLIATKHSLCAQPPILSFQLSTRDGILTLDWLGSYAPPMPFFQDSEMHLSSRNYSLLKQTILRTLRECTAPMNARSLTSITGFDYERVRKMLQRMVRSQEPELVSPARGLYTTSGHPCLAQFPASASTPPAEPPDPTVASVPAEPRVSARLQESTLTPDPMLASLLADPRVSAWLQASLLNPDPMLVSVLDDPRVSAWLQANIPDPGPMLASILAEPPPAAAQATPAKPSDPMVLTNPAAPDLEHTQEARSQTAPVSNVSNIPGTSTTPAAPDPALDQDANPLTAPASNVPNVPTAQKTPDLAID